MHDEENAGSGIPSGAPERPAQHAKKKKGRYAYLDDIHRTADGRYIYTGPCFAYDENVNTRGSVLLRLWLLIIPALAASVIGGCFTTPFHNTWHNIAPLGLEIVLVASAAWAVCRITANGAILREYVRKQTFDALPVRCWLSVGFAALGLIGGAIYMIVRGTGIVSANGEIADQTFRCVAYLCLKAVVIVCCALTARYAPSVEWRATKEKV